jgi:hypothetical protein
MAPESPNQEIVSPPHIHDEVDVEKANSEKANRVEQTEKDVSESIFSSKAESADHTALDRYLPLN